MQPHLNPSRLVFLPGRGVEATLRQRGGKVELLIVGQIALGLGVVQIAQYERVIGAPRLDRSHRPMVLAARGQFLSRRARDVLVQIGRLDEAAQTVAV